MRLLSSSLSLGVLLLVGGAVVGCGSDAPEPDCADEDTCAANDDVTQAKAPFALSAVKKAQYPFVLHHGFNASTTNSWSYYQVKETLEKDGQFVALSEVEPFAGVPKRAASLARQIDDARTAFCNKRFPQDPGCLARTKVNLVAHSMGGLDSRYLISKLGYGDRIASLTTISSPHRGTAVADYALKILPDSGGKAALALNSLMACFGKTFTQEDLAEGSDIRAAMESLSEKNAASFAVQTPNDPRVYYQSWAGVSRAVGGPRYRDSQDLVLSACEGKYFGSIGRADFMDSSLTAGSVMVGRGGSVPQDGMVTVASAKWGNFRGCYPADHLQEVGQKKKSKADAYTLFDHKIFFRNLASELATRGY